jgi:arginine-tRNA-protein transferase
MNNLVNPPSSDTKKAETPTKKVASTRNQMLSKDVNALEKTIQKSGILNALEEITKRALLLSLPNDSGALQPHEWKTQYRLLQPSKRDVKQCRLRATCLVCAQVSGSCNMTSREDLVEAVVTNIQNDEKFRTVAKSGGVCVSDIEAHSQSGQIRCTFQLQDQIMSSSSDHKSRTAAVGDSDDHGDIIMTEDTSSDKLAKWFERTSGKHLEPSHRQITIETMTAHQSALDPEVHKLYAYYQNIVHNDPDPFMGGRKRRNSNDDDDDQDGSEEDIPTDPAELDWGNAPSFFMERIESMLINYLHPVPEKFRNAVLANYYSFYQFLVEAPFSFTQQQMQMQQPRRIDTNDTSSSIGIDCGLYHQHYRIGDVLIAVGVVDILPNCLSSVYLFYHPTFSHELLALGKYAILKEIEYARDTLKVPYYYLGYYIESCQKMRYKAEYNPSQLLCPKYYQWVDAPTAVTKLQKTPRHVCPLVEDNENGAGEGDVASGREQSRRGAGGDSAIDSAIALHQLQMDIGAGINVTIDMLQPNGVEVVKPILEEFISEAGPEMSVQCLVKLT